MNSPKLEDVDMAKFTDFQATREVADIMEGILEKFPRVFPGFDLNKIGFVHTMGKKAKKNPVKIRAVRYPYDVWMNKTYIVEVMDESWQEMSDKKKRLAVFHTMCAMPEGSFDEQSDNYAKIRKPDYEMYAEEFAVSGGVPNWMDNDDACDPDDVITEESSDSSESSALKKVKRVPVTINNLGPSSDVDEDSLEEAAVEAAVS
jgi:hypothetical protein